MVLMTMNLGDQLGKESEILKEVRTCDPCDFCWFLMTIGKGKQFDMKVADDACLVAEKPAEEGLLFADWLTG